MNDQGMQARRSYSASPASSYLPEQVWAPTSELIMDWDEAFHDLMLHDRLRMDAYRKAIFEVVRPGDYVIDLGVGTGILSQWALEAGAARVMGIEMNAHVLEIASRRLASAGLDDRFEPVNLLSFDYSPRQRADVLISEIIGNMGDNENFQPILADAMKRLLVPGGRAIPISVSSYCAPVSARSAHRSLREGAVCRLSDQYRFETLRERLPDGSLFNLYYDCVIPDRQLLDGAKLLCRYDGQWNQPAEYVRNVVFTICRDDVLTGFKVHFVAQLSQATVLDISGGDIASGRTSDSWKHAYLPIEAPIEVRSGDRVELSFARRYPASATSSFHQSYQWAGAVFRSGTLVAEFSQSTLQRSTEQAQC